jgi:hypothetical protein
MKRAAAIILSLFLLLVFVPRAVMNPDGSSYDPMCDVNRDKTIDVYDLNRLGKAYGSTQTIPTQPGKTTIYVYQLETDPPQIENARIAIIDPEYYYQAVQVGYTNSSGIVNFSLNPNSNYTAIAWSQSTYNYGNFTTNESGEASMAIQMGCPCLPPRWVTITYINRTSGGLMMWQDVLYFAVRELAYIYPGDFWQPTEGGGVSIVFENFKGVFVIGPWSPNYPFEAGESYGVVTFYTEILTNSVYTTDENSSANMVTYV